MAIVTPALVTALFTNWKGEFQAALKAAQSQHEKIATPINSTTKSNTYGWLGKFPRFREWIGDRVINDMQAHGYTITNKKYESTVGVPRDDIEDDEVGIYSPMMQEMGTMAALQPDELAFGLLGIGHTVTCYDGQNFFDTEHPVYPKADGTGEPELISNLDVPATDPGPAWFLLDTTRAIKPIILQNRRKPNFISMTKLDDEHVFTTDTFRFGVDCRRNVGFSFWQLAHMSRQPLNADNLWAGITAMRERKADGGQKLGVKPSILVVPPALEKQATRMLERELDSNSSNELKGRLELLVADYL
ncbi:head protein [Terasakiispira papahanaumokuakeensis]|uniref:Head protein n=1 Tax=Terasakiispira papahanaumokuakeensis TaxID=197479 RepID=A0A1E2V8C3_9GAMM|nr:Mu-like prophage major head subunit gpT family protein [Terasakiispira papahanaumokuakeensis]ODC03231.1 head protein [Terasakiispira papahanaumokuakeensis]